MRLHVMRDLLNLAILDDVEPWHARVQNSLENLRVKVAALQEQGITAHMWSGCYRVPSPTLTGSLIRDLQLIEEVVGAGEIAISDHRSSWPSTQVFSLPIKILCSAGCQ